MNILISGISGRMGRILLDVIRASGEHSVITGVDPMGQVPDVPCFASFDEVTVKPDIVIDFSHHSLTASLLAFCTANQLPLVLATTGHTDEEKHLIEEAARQIPLFYSANMSLGVAVLCALAVKTASAFPDADIEIIEKHHNRKADAPSGTALMLLRALQAVRQSAFPVFGRSGQCKRRKDEIGIHSIRAGNFVGEHEVIVSTDSETVSIRHEAHDRSLFAEGALSAAVFLTGKAPGLYTMKDMIS